MNQRKGRKAEKTMSKQEDENGEQCAGTAETHMTTESAASSAAATPEEREMHDVFDRMMNTRLLRVFWPFYHRYKEFLLYGFFGVLTTVISIASYWYFCHIGLNALIGNIFSWILAVLFAYITNSTWVFEAHPGTMAGRLRQMIGFYGGRLATLGMEEAVLFVGINLMHGGEMAVKIIAQVLVFVGNYLISKFLVFRNKEKKKETGGR